MRANRSTLVLRCLYFPTSIFILLLPLTFFGCSKPDGETESAVLNSDEFEFDFGVVRPHEKKTHTFRIKNITPNVLELDGFTTSCNCTSVTVDKKTVDPNTHFCVEATFQAGEKTADLSPTVLCKFRGHEPWVAAMRMHAKVRQPLSADVNFLAWRAVGERGLHRTAFRVRNYSETEWSDFRIESEVPWLRVSIQPCDSDQGATQAWLCHAEPNSEQLLAFGSGDYKSKILLTGAGQQVALPISVSMMQPATLVPSSIFYRPKNDDVAQGNVELAFVFRGETKPTSSNEFRFDSKLNEVLNPRAIQRDDGKWRLRCDITPVESTVRGELRVTIASIGATVTVPVVLTARQTSDEA